MVKEDGVKGNDGVVSNCDFVINVWSEVRWNLGFVKIIGKLCDVEFFFFYLW